MGQVGSFLSRKVNRFNVENRAHRVLERDKPTMAPRYPHSLKDMERTLEGRVYPQFHRCSPHCNTILERKCSASSYSGSQIPG